jgi:hypothetical protein
VFVEMLYVEKAQDCLILIVKREGLKINGINLYLTLYFLLHMGTTCKSIYIAYSHWLLDKYPKLSKGIYSKPHFSLIFLS